MKHKLLALAAFSVAVLAQAQEPDVTIQGLPNHTTISRDDLVWTWQLHASSPRDRHDSLGDLSDWLELGPQLGGFFVPQTLTINSHALSGNITLTASDLSLGAVENTALSTWTGSSNLATLGTVAAGVWHATAIADAYIASASVWNAKANAATTLAGYGITDPIVLTSGSYNDPTWITHLAWSKIASTPTTISGYGIADAVPNSRTVNGHALSSNVTVAYSDLTGLPTLGTSAAKDIPATGNASSSQVVYGTDTRLSDARTPSAHASSHKSGGTDAVKLDELAAPTDVTTLNATTGAHGLLPKLGGGTTNFLRADGTWNAPAGGGGTATALSSATTTVDVSASTAPTTGKVLTATDSTHATWQSQAGGGDMTRAVYDHGNAGYISGTPGSIGGVGGKLNMSSLLFGNGGDINTSAAATGSGGGINTSTSGFYNGGAINTSGNDNGVGGNITTASTSSPGGNINTGNGGGSIDTTGTGSIGYGVSGTRTTVVGTASVDHVISWPDAAGTVLLANGSASALTGVLSSSAGGAGAVTGLLKADGAGNVSAAAAGTDYQAPLPGSLTASGILKADGAGNVSAATDTSWTANASSGDKTVAIPNYTNVDFTATDAGGLGSGFPATAAALNLMDAQIQALTKKVQALETALAASLLPNQ